MKRGLEIFGIVFLVIVISGGLVTFYVIAKAQRETQETLKALQDENNNLNRRLDEVRQENKNLKLSLEIEELRRLNNDLEESMKKYAPPPGPSEPGKLNPLDERYQDVPHPDATKRQRRTFS